jgi:hypothetical protein
VEYDINSVDHDFSLNRYADINGELVTQSFSMKGSVVVSHVAGALEPLIR